MEHYNLSAAFTISMHVDGTLKDLYDWPYKATESCIAKIAHTYSDKNSYAFSFYSAEQRFTWTEWMY